MSGSTTVMKPQEPSVLIITRSFNGLMDPVAEVDHFNVWYVWSKARKAAKNQKRQPTIRLSEVTTLTGLTRGPGVVHLCHPAH